MRYIDFFLAFFPSDSIMNLKRILLSISLCLSLTLPAAAAPVRLKDLISIQGVRENVADAIEAFGRIENLQ